MSPVIDFSNVKGLEPLPVGEYLAKVVHAEEGLSATGNPKIDMRWEIIAPEQYSGRQVMDTLSFHPDALFQVKNKLVGMGFGKDFSGEVSAEMLMDKEAALTLKIEDSGKIDPETGDPYPPRNKVGKIRPAEKYGQTNATNAASALEGMEVPAATPEAQPRARRAR